MATIENFATVSYTSGGITETRTSNLATVGVESAINIQRSSLGNTYSENSEITHITSLSNTSASAITNVTVTDDLGTYTSGATEYTPLTYNQPALLLINGQDATAQLTVDDTLPNRVVFTIASLPANSTANIVYQNTVNAFAPLAQGSTIVSTSTLSSDAGCTDGTASETLTVASSADITVLKEMTPNPVVCGDIVTYTIRVINSGNIPAESLQVSDQFDPAPTDIAIQLNGASLPDTSYTYQNGLLTIAPTGAGTITVPAATFGTDPATGAVTVTPGVVEIVITGRI